MRELADSEDLEHGARMSLRDDIARAEELGKRVSELKGRAVAVFSCRRHELYEELVLKRTVRDRASVDATCYLRPVLAVLDETHRYCVAVVDRARAWLYEFSMGRLEETRHRRDGAPRKRDHAGGWQGYREHATHNRAQLLARKHFRATVDDIDELMRSTSAELLVIGGHQETVAEFLPFLPRHIAERVAGTFVVDPATMTPGRVRERAEEVVDAYEREEERRLVTDVLDRAASGGLGAYGLAWCLVAVNEQAVQLLLVDDEQEFPGLACGTCGWLGVDGGGTSAGGTCPVCGSPLRTTPDVIDEMAARGDRRRRRGRARLRRHRAHRPCGGGHAAVPGAT